MVDAKVFITRPYHTEATSLLKNFFEVEVWKETVTPPRPYLMQKMAECEGILTESYDRIDREIFEAVEATKVVSNRAIGTDNIDILAATEHGVLIGNTPGVLHESCADLVFALILDVSRRVSQSDRVVREGRWKMLEQLSYMGTDVYGKTLGIVGMGLIGHAVARRARGFDMKIIYFSRTRKPDVEQQLGLQWAPDLSTLLGESDIVSLHMPLTDETEVLIGESEFKQMKRGAFLINTTRGRTVDQKALYHALTNEMIAGAGLDVTVPEPISPDDPIISLSNVVITPHIASATTATFNTMGRMAAQNIISALKGQPMPSCINPESLANRR
uniref:2 lactate dehydrogenase and related dehydrogenases n=1 Tax=uncultured Chloroflexi bacterium HF0500_03M05 TaxID=710737 RepID=E0XY63_9CHLR|nr:2 lactate dehydrogenase and related dehydrogenases [uncultured Chloroflexi bacterium HF0500_03M05]